MRDAFIQLSISNPGWAEASRMAVVRGEGRVSVAIFGRFGMPLWTGALSSWQWLQHHIGGSLKGGPKG